MIMVRYWKIKWPKDSNLTGFKHILSFSLLLLLVACAPDAPPKIEDAPDWVIPEDKMTDLLTDMHIIEGARIGTRVLGDTLSVNAHYEKLWEKYEVSAAIYDSSFRFYSRNAERMDLMYEEVLTRLTKMSTRNTVPNEREPDDEDEKRAKAEKKEKAKALQSAEKDSTATAD